MITILIVAMSACIYLMVGGVWSQRFYLHRVAACAKTASQIGCYHDHGMTAALAGLLWPLSIPVFVGALAGSWSPESRQARELRVAQHKAELAEAAAREEEALERRYRALMREDSR